MDAHLVVQLLLAAILLLALIGTTGAAVLVVDLFIQAQEASRERTYRH